MRPLIKNERSLFILYTTGEYEYEDLFEKKI